MRLASLSTSGSNPSVSQSKTGRKSLISRCNFGKSSPCGYQRLINSSLTSSVALGEFGVLEKASVFVVRSSIMGFRDEICRSLVLLGGRNLELTVGSKMSAFICAMKLSSCISSLPSKFTGVS